MLHAIKNILCIGTTYVLLLVCPFSVYAQELFQVGETFTYKLKWLKLPVATFQASIKGIDHMSGRDVYVIEFSGETNHVASLIYPVHDRFVSYVDTKTLTPLRLEVSRREGFYKKDAETFFDHAKGKAYFQNFLDRSQKEYAIPPETYDLISVFYKLRTKKIILRETLTFQIAFAETLFTVHGTAIEEKKIKLPNGEKMKAYYTEPSAYVGERKIRDGTVSAYFSQDAYRIPLRIVLKAPLFTKIVATLSEGPNIHDQE